MNNKLTAQLEALLYIYGEPMEIKKIAKTLKTDEAKVREAAAALAEDMKAEGRGLFLVSDKDTIQLTTKPEFAALMESVIKEELHESLTPAALETLAIVTYAGPLSRAEIEYIRGVNSSFTLRNLLIRGLIERSQDPKRANAFLYTASMDLVKHLGIASVGELPEYSRFRELIEKLRNPIAEPPAAAPAPETPANDRPQ